MRQRLLEATVECLVEHGWSGTSTTLVSQRAGRQPGCAAAPLPDQDDLVVAAVEHLSEVRGEELARRRARLPSGKRRTRAVLEMFADHFTSPVFTAALELWVAARTDESLHAAVVPLEQRVGREAHRIAVDALGVDESQPRVRELVQATLDLVRGLGLGRHDHRRHRPAPQDPQRLGAHPRRRAGSVNPSPRRPFWSRCSATSTPRVPTRRRWLPRWTRPVGVRRPRQPAGTSQPRSLISRWTDEVALAAATDKEQWDAFVIKAMSDPDGLRRCRGSGRGQGSSGGAARALARSAGGAGRRAAELPGRTEDALVRPADESDLDGDGAVHGDLGALARRGRDPGRRAGAQRPDPARGPPRRSHPQLLLCIALAPSRPPRSSGSSCDRLPVRSGNGDQPMLHSRCVGRRTTSACG